MDLGGGNNSGGAKQEQEQEQEQEHLFFRKGSKVEVSSDEEGFRDAWYVATILNVPTNTNSNSRKRKRRNSKTTSTATNNNNNNDNKYLVEYDTLLADDDATKPLREFVDVSFMRPVDDHPPPRPPSFQLYDIVDASYRDGWWTGIITRINHSHSDSKFLVFFQNPPDEIEFAPSQLRLHRDWVDRKWVIPQKQGIVEQKGEVNHQRRKRGRPKVLVEKPIGLVEGVEASGRQDAKAMQSPAIASTCINVSGKNRDWPFVKRSPIWENLECMEIFKKMPQQPHFQPLGKSKEDIREGLAIANMVTFANVVLWTSKLQFSDPRSVIDSHLETLSDLEAHGFNVDPIRGRLNELLSKKVRQGKLLAESKGVAMKINEQSLEKNKIDEEIHEIDKKMEELQEKLALATSMTKMKDNEIGALRSKKEVIDRDILKAQLDFEGLAAVPL
ncbi:DUF724 domain-containing protein 7 [Camellia lanceoleosa]|uniref:DUF724 domain-containing protein 7 n=1 Tax=Camellia lanceoleosa TaxID=1840588 RepID=A0ACC0F9B3_9ERIC|nr:DUF724 domain-containing protein 7 [Camellia lanceoleosa]